MKTIVQHGDGVYEIDLARPLDISISLKGDVSNVNAWYLDHPVITAHKELNFVGSVAKGAAVNFNDIQFNPHAHCTHTECVGHITKEFHSINKNLHRFFFIAEVITIAPGKLKDDFIISKKQLENALSGKKPEALIVRTLPNTTAKESRQYSNTNPPYFLEEAAEYLREIGVEHLLMDLPSIDKEKDDGALSAHKAFWDFNGQIRMNATITEFIYVDNTILDGSYFLNLQIAAIENDASPSRPVLYSIENR